MRRNNRKNKQEKNIVSFRGVNLQNMSNYDH